MHRAGAAANIAGLYAPWHGPDGLRRIAERTHRIAPIIARAAQTGGLRVLHDSWFDTVQIEVPDARLVHERARTRYDLRPVSDTVVGIAVDETSDLQTVHDVLAARRAGARTRSRHDQRHHGRAPPPPERRRAAT
ncbi:MAG: hypothetical protein R2713_16575 [Ilumatobacteraceae bacterium]